VADIAVLAAIRATQRGTPHAHQQSMRTPATYRINAKWTIVEASDEFCRLFRASESALVGRDIRDLLRADWRPDFRTYVARALVGVGNATVTVPFVAPCGKAGWFTHTLEPVMHDELLAGYRATLTPRAAHATSGSRRWWEWRRASSESHQVWNFEAA
jgi:hypothetical protein